jgi:hypothetical protein
MSNKPSDFRQQLLDAETMTPALRDEHQKALAAMLEYRLTPCGRLSLATLLLVMLAFTAAGARALLFFYRGPWLYGVWVAFTIACAASAAWIVGSLWRRRFLWRSYYPVADLFTVGAAVITVLVLTMGLGSSSDPSSSFAALYALTLLIVCIAWSLHNRIAAAELATREQSLRIECRLADLASRHQR